MKKRISKSRLKAIAPIRKKSPHSAAAKAKTPATDSDSGASPAKRNSFSIVGIGASAGGYEAFVKLLAHLPKETGMAFVLVQHLDPKHESKLSELLARATSLPLVEAANGMLVKPNRIYVMPPNINMLMVAGHLKFLPRKANVPHLPVDMFFRSLAADQQNRAIGIVLSGTGSDGTLGLQAIKSEGGITFAQDEKSAKYFGMPGSAIDASCVDIVTSPEEIARELGRVAHHPYVGGDWQSQPKGVVTAETDKVFLERDGELQGLFALLRVRAKVDFSQYKHSTLKRRILRRMLLHKMDTLPAYLDYVRANVPELDALFNDLLINVTGFFRDPSVFQALKRRLFPKLLKHRPSGSPLRVWVCGCSTGEEAYSLAIIMVEFFETWRLHANVQVFATDISEVSLQKARAGLYPENISLEVSPERLRRFFIRVNGSYQVNKSIRDMCVFARQNVVVDPPFSNLDLISCRNVLIYMGQVLQKKVMPLFHYALKPDGCLLLGSSESIGVDSKLFALWDKRNKVYMKKLVLTRHVFMPVHKDLVGNLPVPRPESVPVVGEIKPLDLQQYADRLILSKWSPAAVVINAQMDVLLFRGRTGAFLEHAAGSASLNLLKMAREGLALDLRTLISEAIKQESPVRRENILLRHHDNLSQVAIEVVPFQLTISGERFYLVLFQDSPFRVDAARPGGEHASLPTVKARQARERHEISDLRQELAANKESLQAIIEEQEATNEELKSANEEIQSSNEELQSTNEELETAKEELQSTNEELTTLNEELETRNTELSGVNNDLTNLLLGVNAAIIVLGGDQTVRRFTPMAERIFNLIPSDVGRRLSDLNRNLKVPDLDQSIRQVVDHLTTVEREVQDRAGRWYSLRIRPYRTRENNIDGVLLLLVDIDEHKKAMELAMSAVKQPMIALLSDLRVKNANKTFYDTFQVTPEETEGEYIYELGQGQWNLPKLRTLLEDILLKQEQVDNFVVEANFPTLGHRSMRVDARTYSEDGRGRRLILLAIRDMTA